MHVVQPESGGLFARLTSGGLIHIPCSYDASAHDDLHCQVQLSTTGEWRRGAGRTRSRCVTVPDTLWRQRPWQSDTSGRTRRQRRRRRLKKTSC